VPLLPVLPGSVAGCVARPVAPLPVAVAHVVEARPAAVAPAYAVVVVESSLGRVAEEVVGGDDEAVAVCSCCLWDAPGWRAGRVVCVWVVELD
jgi:hypothetical protein